MISFFLKKSSTLPVLRVKVLRDGRSLYDTNDLSLTASTVYFSMIDEKTGIKKILKEPCSIYSTNQDIVIQYQFKSNSIKKTGSYIGEFFIISQNEYEITPIYDKIRIEIIDSVFEDASIECCGSDQNIIVIPSLTPSVTVTQTPTVESTKTPLPTRTPTKTPTQTPTTTPTNTPTNTVTPTFTPTSTQTPTQTPTNSVTPSQTPTHTVTPTNTFTPTSTQTPSVTPSVNCNIIGLEITSVKNPNYFGDFAQINIKCTGQTGTWSVDEIIANTGSGDIILTANTNYITESNTGATPTIETIISGNTITNYGYTYTLKFLSPFGCIESQQITFITPSQTPTVTPTKTSTPTVTPTQTTTQTSTQTPTITQTSSPTTSFTPTQTNTISPTNTVTPTKTVTPTRTPTLTPSPEIPIEVKFGSEYKSGSLRATYVFTASTISSSDYTVSFTNRLYDESRSEYILIQTGVTINRNTLTGSTIVTLPDITYANVQKGFTEFTGITSTRPNLTYDKYAKVTFVGDSPIYAEYRFRNCCPGDTPSEIYIQTTTLDWINNGGSIVYNGICYQPLDFGTTAIYAGIYLGADFYGDCVDFADCSCYEAPTPTPTRTPTKTPTPTRTATQTITPSITPTKTTTPTPTLTPACTADLGCFAEGVICDLGCYSNLVFLTPTPTPTNTVTPTPTPLTLPFFQGCITGNIYILFDGPFGSGTEYYGNFGQTYYVPELQDAGYIDTCVTVVNEFATYFVYNVSEPSSVNTCQYSGCEITNAITLQNCCTGDKYNFLIVNIFDFNDPSVNILPSVDQIMFSNVSSDIDFIKTCFQRVEFDETVPFFGDVTFQVTLYNDCYNCSIYTASEDCFTGRRLDACCDALYPNINGWLPPYIVEGNFIVADGIAYEVGGPFTGDVYFTTIETGFDNCNEAVSASTAVDCILPPTPTPTPTKTPTPTFTITPTVTPTLTLTPTVTPSSFTDLVTFEECCSGVRYNFLISNIFSFANPGTNLLPDINEIMFTNVSSDIDFVKNCYQRVTFDYTAQLEPTVTLQITLYNNCYACTLYSEAENCFVGRRLDSCCDALYPNINGWLPDYITEGEYIVADGIAYEVGGLFPGDVIFDNIVTGFISCVDAVASSDAPGCIVTPTPTPTQTKTPTPTITRTSTLTPTPTVTSTPDPLYSFELCAFNYNSNFSGISYATYTFNKYTTQTYSIGDTVRMYIPVTSFGTTFNIEQCYKVIPYDGSLSLNTTYVENGTGLCGSGKCAEVHIGLTNCNTNKTIVASLDYTTAEIQSLSVGDEIYAPYLLNEQNALISSSDSTCWTIAAPGTSITTPQSSEIETYWDGLIDPATGCTDTVCSNCKTGFVLTNVSGSIQTFSYQSCSGTNYNVTLANGASSTINICTKVNKLFHDYGLNITITGGTPC